MKTKEGNKKHIAINTHLILVFILFLSFIWLTIQAAVEKEIWFAIGSGFFTCLWIFAFIISPLYFVFDDEKVKIVYNFGLFEIIYWNSIRRIYLKGGWLTRGGGPPNYVIVFPQKEKRIFFVMGEIPKTRKTEKMIRLYYKGNIV